MSWCNELVDLYSRKDIDVLDDKKKEELKKELVRLIKTDKQVQDLIRSKVKFPP